MTGITESKDVTNLLKVLAACLKEVLKDGRVDLSDVPSLWPLVGAAKTAYEGSEKIPAELKDLTGDEVAELVTTLVQAGYSLIDAIVKKAA